MQQWDKETPATPTKQEFDKGENEKDEGNQGGPREREKSTFKLFYSLTSKDDIR